MSYKIIISTITVLIFITLVSVSQQRKIHLPKTALKVLDAKFKKWRFSETTIDLYSSDGKPTKKEFVDLTSGNYNSDDKPDFAAMIIVQDSVEPKGRLVALLSSKSGYNIYILDSFVSYDNQQYVDTYAKGNTAYDENNPDGIVLKRDAIEYGYQEKGGMIYYFDGTKFIYLSIGDGC